VRQPECSASTNGLSSRTIQVAIGGTAYPNPGLCDRCVETGSHAFARCSAESREGVGDAEDAVFDFRNCLDATRLRNGHFHLGMGIPSAQYTERCDGEDGGSHALILSPYVQAKSYRCRSRSASSSVKSRHCWGFRTAPAAVIIVNIARQWVAPYTVTRNPFLGQSGCCARSS
jgi:hypothetical protein